MVAVVDRLIGKHGFMHSARPCLRSIFQAAYPWIASVRHHRHGKVVIPDDVWVELCVSALLIGFAQFSLSSPWSQRIECTDASMTGLGRAFGVIPTHVAQALARYSDHPSVYTNLKLPWSIGLKEEHACPLRKVRLPAERIRWTEVGVPWESTHITLGEADAICWAAEDRLRRPSDDGCRFIHPLDPAACVGSFSKGRSSSKALNSRCRRLASINIAGGHECFYPWVPSKDNPADRPSRRFERGSEPGGGAPELDSAKPVSDLRELGVWPADTKFFIHLCSGPRRNGDLIDAVEKSCAEIGMNVVGLAVDPLAQFGFPDVPQCHADLLDYSWLNFLLDIIDSGSVLGGFGSPPCCTISAARHVPLKPGQSYHAAPRPLRARLQPWICLPNRTEKEEHAVRVGSALFLIVLGMLGEIAARGGWVGLEHPADRGREPYPSFFATKETQTFCEQFQLRYQVIHQCMFGAITKKPTGLLLPQRCTLHAPQCNHSKQHSVLIGLDEHGMFRTHRQLNIPVVFVGLWQKFLQIGWTWLVTVHIPNLLLQGLGTKPHQFHGIRVGMDGGFGLDRVQVFLLNSLKQSTIDKYTKALQHLSNELADQQLVWSDMDEEDQDKFVAEWLLSGYEAGHHRAEYGWALSAVQKVCPRVRLRTSWKVYDAWGQKEPPKQAPAAPPELLHAMFAVALLLNRPALAALMVSCYAGLLRVREALALRQQDVVLQATEVILCLGQTKRGLEQKVVMRNPSVVAFFMQYFKRFPVSHGEPVFSISYSSALRWVKRLAFLLGCDDLSLTTHTFRRSGASELARQGLPLADILLYGRWSTERSAREYIRQGEVGIVRARQQLQPVTAARIQQWASINRSPWAVYDKLFKFKSITVNVEQVTVARFHEFEGAIFNTFQSEGVVGRQWFEARWQIFIGNGRWDPVSF